MTMQTSMVSARMQKPYSPLRMYNIFKKSKRAPKSADNWMETNYFYVIYQIKMQTVPAKKYSCHLIIIRIVMLEKMTARILWFNIVRTTEKRENS